MANVGGNFRQGSDDKSSFVHTGVRHLEYRRVYDLITEEQQIEVNGARPPRFGSDAAEVVLDALHGGVKLFCRALAVELGNCVEERSLPRRPSHRLGFDDGRNSHHLDIRTGVQSGNRLLNSTTAVPQVAAQGNVSSCS